MTLFSELTCSRVSFYANQLDFGECLPKTMDFCFNVEY